MKWYHQFQFAGYYAAVEKGFYVREGLDVTLTTPDDGIYPVESVLDGRAQYGVSSADLIKERTEGSPIVVIAVVFQHSPIVLLSRKDNDLQYLSDYVGKRLMASDDDFPEIRAMFAKEGIDPFAIDIVPHTGSVDSIIAGHVDAAADYISNEPYQMRLMGVEPRVIQPIDYGIDFYADTLFTTTEETERHPQRVKAFRRASLRGWEYALENVDEMIDLIMDMPGVRERGKTKELLRYEASHITHLIQPKLVEIGHMNPARWDSMARTYAEFGIIPQDYSLAGFIYNPYDQSFKYKTLISISITVLLVTCLTILGFILWNANLRKEVRRQTEKLEESEEKFRYMVKNSIDSFVIIAADGTQKYISPVAEKATGFSVDELCVSFAQFIHPDDLDSVLEMWNFCLTHPDKSARIQYRHRHRAGGWVDFEAVGQNCLDIPAINGVIVNVRDITERKEAELEREKLRAQLIHSQKMESVGRLAGGVAHDFNNMLSVIISHADLGLMKMPLDSPIIPRLKEIKNAALRSAELTRQLLSFARRQIVKPRTLNLNEAVSHILDMLKRLIGENIRLDWQPVSNPWPVKIDPTQLDQVLANLCVNARDAIEDTGTITIITDNVVIDQDYAGQHVGLCPGEFVLLAISDNGCGMDEEVCSQVFEPFFTTKEVGKGTGLGLATVYGIVKQHGGYIYADSQVSKGSLFRIYLPKAVFVHEEKVVMTENINGTRGCETILLVEDEPMIIDIAAAMLEEFGYRVIHAQTPGEALMIAESGREKFDMLLTDIIMPEMNGRELAERLLGMYPQLKVLFMSGYIPHDNLEEEGRFIKKPFNVDVLALKVREVLNR